MNIPKSVENMGLVIIITFLVVVLLYIIDKHEWLKILALIASVASLILLGVYIADSTETNYIYFLGSLWCSLTFSIYYYHKHTAILEEENKELRKKMEDAGLFHDIEN